MSMCSPTVPFITFVFPLPAARMRPVAPRFEKLTCRYSALTDHFGANMTSLNFMLSRTVGRGFEPGDEILVSSLDHDGGVAPWIELAHDHDLRVQHIELAPDSTLDYDDLRSKLTERTRVVAFAWASNAIGTIVDAARVAELAHSVGALCWVDAVHYAAHEPIDVHAIVQVGAECAP